MSTRAYVATALLIGLFAGGLRVYRLGAYPFGEAGNLSGATQKLRAAATRLLDLGELDLAQKAQDQAAQLEQGQSMNPEAQKELRYATRRLTQKLEE